MTEPFNRSCAHPTEAELRAIHLRDHLTDGRWHDDCSYCLRRREHGGTGVRCTATITPNDLTYQCERSEGHDGEHKDWRVSWSEPTALKGK